MQCYTALRSQIEIPQDAFSSIPSPHFGISLTQPLASLADFSSGSRPMGTMSFVRNTASDQPRATENDALAAVPIWSAPKPAEPFSNDCCRCPFSQPRDCWLGSLNLSLHASGGVQEIPQPSASVACGLYGDIHMRFAFTKSNPKLLVPLRISRTWTVR